MSLQSDSRSFFNQYYPIAVIFLCALFAAYKYVLQISPSVMTADLMRAFHVNGAGLGNLAATYFYAYLIAQLFAGVLLDRYSPRYLMTFAIGLSGFAVFSFSQAQSLGAAGLYRAFMGVGTAFMTIGYMKMSVLWFKPNRVALVDGFCGTACMIGAMCGQIPLAFLAMHFGWRLGLLYCGCFGIALATLFWMVVRDKKTPVSVGVTTSAVAFNNIMLILKDKKNWILMLYSGLAFTPVAVLGGLWGNPFFEEAYHLTATQAASFSSCLFLGFGVGGPVLGYFAGTLNQRLRMTFLGTLIALVSLILVIYVNSLPLFLLGTLLFVFGFGMGSYMACFSIGKEINPIGFAATVVALINTGDALLGSITEPVIGKMLDIFWDGKIVNGVHYFSVQSFQWALSLLPLYLLIALGCLWVLRKMLFKSMN